MFAFLCQGAAADHYNQARDAGSTPDELGAYMRADMAKWKKLVHDAKLRLH
jgi:hypothetical protein